MRRCGGDALGRFIAVAGTTYQHHPVLEAVEPEVEDLRELLAGSLHFDVLENPDRGTVRAALESLEGSVPDGGPLVLLWAGHAVEAGAEGLRLLTREDGSSPMAGIPVGEVAGFCAQSGASQLLLVFDTCYSGAAADAARAAVSRVLAAQPPDARCVWLGVLTRVCRWRPRRTGCSALGSFSCSARDRLMMRLVGDGLSTTEFLRGDDLCHALVSEWDTELQQPQYDSRGAAWWLLPNPLFEPEAPAEVVAHLVQAARGGAGEASWFTGRRDEVEHRSQVGHERGVRVAGGDRFGWDGKVGRCRQGGLGRARRGTSTSAGAARNRDRGPRMLSLNGATPIPVRVRCMRMCTPGVALRTRSRTFSATSWWFRGWSPETGPGRGGTRHCWSVRCSRRSRPAVGYRCWWWTGWTKQETRLLRSLGSCWCGWPDRDGDRGNAGSAWGGPGSGKTR